MNSARLDEIGVRIERLVVEPGSISAPFTRLLRPLLCRIGWAPRPEIEEISALVTEIAELSGIPNERMVSMLGRKLDRAVDELEDNLRRVERATVVNRRALVAHADWLRRLYEVVVHAQRALDRTAGTGDSGVGAAGAVDIRIVGAVDPARLQPPLSMKGARLVKLDDDGQQGDDRERGTGEEDGEEAAKTRPDPTRVVELQLDTIDHVLDAAAGEDALLDRRRRLLEAARQLLLETSAALALENEGVRVRLESIARQITRIDRLEAVGLSGDVDLLHQARSAIARGQRDKVYAALQAMDQAALARGDRTAGALTRAALEQMGERPAPTAKAAARAAERAIERSSREIFGDEVIEAIADGYREGRALADMSPAESEFDEWMIDLFTKYLAPGRERATMATALAVDGCFDLGGVMSPVRIKEDHIRLTAVPFPTQDLVLLRARGPEDLGDAVISDPRTVILDLAAGRLLARRYIREEVERRERTVLKGEVRVYVLDGSGSMLGPRARMRDAILVAELATLMRRLTHNARSERVVLFYRYFNTELLPVHEVDTPGGALQAIREVMATPRYGGTDIEGALLASLEQVRVARESDPYLARAQIVLITDGEAPVDETKVTAARAQLGDLAVGVSVIALGEENWALQELVARQRGRGERAFYHFLPDSYLRQLGNGEIDGGRPVHAPPVMRDHAPAHEVVARLQTRVGSLVEEMADLRKARNTNALEALDLAERRWRMRVSSTGSDAEETEEIAPVPGEGQRARLEALHRDHRALAHRFERFFPDPSGLGADGDTTLPPQEGTRERDDLDSVLVLFATVTEVVELVEGSELGRRADAIDLLERLLPNARLSPARYHLILRGYPRFVAPGLQAVRDAVRWGVYRHLPGR